MQLTGNHLNLEYKKFKSVRRMNAEDCIVLSIHPWYVDYTH